MQTITTRQFTAYTDGACSGNPGPGGWAVVIDESQNMGLQQTEAVFGGYSEETTNNRMELTAALEALKYIVNEAAYVNDCSCSGIIYSDSAYVVNAMNNGWLMNWAANDWFTKSGTRVKNSDIWREMYDCVVSAKDTLDSMKFYKVKGHSGVIMNEMADQEAVRQRDLAKKKTKSRTC